MRNRRLLAYHNLYHEASRSRCNIDVTFYLSDDQSRFIELNCHRCFALYYDSAKELFHEFRPVSLSKV